MQWPAGIALAALAGVNVLVALVGEVFVESLAAVGHDASNFTRICRFIIVTPSAKTILRSGPRPMRPTSFPGGPFR